MGLRLAVCRKVIEVQGGTISGARATAAALCSASLCQWRQTERNRAPAERTPGGQGDIATR